MPYRCPHCGETSASEFYYRQTVSETHTQDLGIDSDGDEITAACPCDDGDVEDSEFVEVFDSTFTEYYCKSCCEAFDEFEYFEDDDEDEDEDEDDTDGCEAYAAPSAQSYSVKQQATSALQKINSEDYKAGIRVLRDLLEEEVIHLPVALTQQIKATLNSGDPDFPTIRSLLQKLS